MAKILVVDDYEPIVVMLAACLSDAGHEVVTAGDGAAGLAVARAERPDLALLDVDMPEMDGLALCAALRVATAEPRPRVVMMSGRLSPMVLAKARLAGACGAIPKPFCRAALLAEIERLLSESVDAV